MVLTVSEATFTEEVLQSDMPVLVNFWAPWCGVCRLINPMLNTLQSECGVRVKLVSVNADENLRLANTYRLTTLPTVILFDGGGVSYRLDGFRTRDDLRIASKDLKLALETLVMSYSYPA